VRKLRVNGGRSDEHRPTVSSSRRIHQDSLGRDKNTVCGFSRVVGRVVDRESFVMIITVSEHWQQRGIRYRVIGNDMSLDEAVQQTIALNRQHPTLTFRLIATT
jgi:hypothetical protein